MDLFTDHYKSIKMEAKVLLSTCLFLLAFSSVLSDNFKCYSIDKAVKRAPIVFSGRVDAILFSNQVALLNIKRVLKDNSNPTWKFLIAGEQVKVNISNKIENGVEEIDGVCDEYDYQYYYENSAITTGKKIKHILRIGDTKVFLVHHLGAGKRVLARIKQDYVDTLLELDSQPLPITLDMLDRVHAAVKDMSYKPRPPIIEEPCEKTFCAFGANCVAEADGRAHCQCPVDCPTVFTPVCGTDGTTYANHCLLRKKSCQDKKNTRVQHSGECGAQRTASRSRP